MASCVLDASASSFRAHCLAIAASSKLCYDITMIGESSRNRVVGVREVWIERTWFRVSLKRIRYDVFPYFYSRSFCYEFGDVMDNE